MHFSFDFYEFFYTFQQKKTLYYSLSLAFARQLPLGRSLNAAANAKASLQEGGGIASAMPEGVIQRFYRFIYHSRMTLMTPSALSRASSR